MQGKADMGVGPAPMGPVAPEGRGSGDVTGPVLPPPLPNNSPTWKDALPSDSSDIPSFGGIMSNKGDPPVGFHLLSSGG